MLKWIGAGIIVSLSFYIGLAMGQTEKRRIAELTAFSRLLHEACDSVKTLRLPVSAIYAAFRDETLEKNGFLPRLREIASSGRRDALGGAVREQMAEKRLSLTEEDAAELLAFSADFGAGDGEQEERRCAYYAERLDRRLNEVRNDAPSEIRVCRALCTCAGVLCVLLLL